MKKKFFSAVISIILVLTTALILPVQVYAKQPTFIKDIILCTGTSIDDAASKATAKGYTPIKNDLNKGNGNVVIMGYLPTENKEEAITDLAAMTEKGGYSFGQYEDILKEKEQTVADLVNGFKVAIEEFRENYEAEEPAAIMAYNMLNLMTNDDMNNMGLGDMFVSEDTTDEQLKVVFMQSRSEFISNIELYLAIACSSNPWVSELENLETDGTYEPSIADDARCIYNTLEAFQRNMNQLLALGIDKDTTDEESDSIYNNCTENEKSIFLTNYPAFKLIKGITYLDYNLFDLLMTDLESLDMSLLYPMASIMTPGQIATFEYIPFGLSVTNNVMEADEWESKFDEAKETDEFGNLKTVSVFSGVDRTIFSPEGIAVTSKALLYEQTTAESIVKPQKLIENANEICLALALFGWASLGAAAIVFSSKTIWATKLTVKAINAMPYIEHYMAYGIYDAVLAKYTAIFVKATGVLVGVAIAAFLILAAIQLINKYIDCSKHPKYTEMPRIIVDIDITKSEDYIYYYCAKDNSGNLADVNAWNGEKWTGIYYTTDPDAGKPLTVESIVNYGLSNNAAPTSADKTYRPVHYFGETAAYNLNRNSNYKKTVAESDYVYMYFVEDTSTVTASVFSGKVGYALAGFGGLLVGAVTSFLITKGKNKGKKEKEEATA